MKSISKRKISGSNPDKLFLTPDFWIREQRDILFVLLISILILIGFWKYTYSDFSTYLRVLSNIFNLCIHSLGVWGVIVASKAVFTVEIEQAIANEIRLSGEQGLRETKRIDLSRLEENYLPINKTEPALAMPRLFRHICKEATNLKFESSINVVEPYQDEALESLFTITNIQKIALRAGILGTFIGLLEAITMLAKTDSSQTPMAAINSLSDALLVSFSTSIAGLEVSILLGFLIMILRKRQGDYFRDMESSVEVILLLARNANNDQSRILGELAQVESSIEQLGKRLYENTNEIQRSVAAVLDRIREQTTEIQGGVQQLKQTKTEFDEFIGDISQVQSRFIREVSGVYDDLSLKGFKDDLKDGIIFAGQTVSNRVGETETSMQKQTAQINEGIKALLETRIQFTSFLQQIDSSQVKFIKNVKESQDTVAMVNASAELKATINQAVKRMDEMAITMREVNKSLSIPLMERIRKNFLG